MNGAVTVLRRHPKKRFAQSPLVVLLHGRGADERDVLAVADRLPRRFGFASVRAPLALAEGGYAWFESRGVAQPVARSLRASLAGFRDRLERIGTSNYHGPVVLFGFSAGMMMAGAVPLSGALPFDAGIDAPDERPAGVPIFHGHGLLDDVIPDARVARTARYLRERSGASLVTRTYPIAHAISHPELADVGAWLETIV